MRLRLRPIAAVLLATVLAARADAQSSPDTAGVRRAALDYQIGRAHV